MRGRLFLAGMGYCATGAVVFLVIVHAARGEWDQALAFASAAIFHAIGVTMTYRGWKLMDKYGDLLQEELKDVNLLAEERARVVATLDAVMDLHDRLAEYGDSVAEKEAGASEPEGADASTLPAPPLN